MSDLVDTPTAALELGVAASTIRSWRSRGLVTPAGLVRGRGGLQAMWKLDELRRVQQGKAEQG